MHPFKQSALAFALITALAACGGGGGGGGNNNGNQPDPGTDPDTGGSSDTTTLLPCVNTATIQCSGATVTGTENSIAMTESGVQVYGRSTSDLVGPTDNPSTGTAWGLEPVSGGTAEVRVQKNASGAVTQAGLLLTNVDIKWGRTTDADRPQVIDIFSNTQGRATLAQDANRSILFGPLPRSSDLNHYDWAEKGAAGTQASYANNVYFPRTEPIRCPTDGSSPGCSEDYATYAAQQQPQVKLGSWRTNGQPVQTAADEFSVRRFHEDGDLRAGDDKPGPNGEPRWISDSDGFGVSYPGFKGYRSLDNWSYQYANLSSWFTQDTVEIVEWAGGMNEHNKNRRGLVAYGDVTSPSAIPSGPTGGSVTYAGAVYGFYAPTARAGARPAGTTRTAAQAIADAEAEDVQTFRGRVSVTVNFATGVATANITDIQRYDSTGQNLPFINLSTTATIGGANSGPRNYFAGQASNATFTQGGLGGRFFGPVVADGPAELGGTLTLRGGTNGQAVIAGFIARKQ